MSQSAQTFQPPKSWELSLYELHRTPQEAITDDTEIVLSPRSLHSELMCPICLDMLTTTMTTKECLHRFCHDCIITALRAGNKECPTCRKKLVSKRSLRRDPNFDSLIEKIYPNRDEYEAHQEQVLEKLNQHTNQQALTNSIEEGLRLQAQNRLQRMLKQQQKKAAEALAAQEAANAANEVTEQVDNDTKQGITEADEQKEASSLSNNKNTNNVREEKRSSSQPQQQQSSNKASKRKPKDPASGTTTGTSTPTKQLLVEDDSGAASATAAVGSPAAANPSEYLLDEIELVFHPHPDFTHYDSRYIKTTSNATMAHLSRFLLVRARLDKERQEGTECDHFKIFALTESHDYHELEDTLTLGDAFLIHWREHKPLELFFSPVY